jgi:hypothetical protein
VYTGPAASTEPRSSKLEALFIGRGEKYFFGRVERALVCAAQLGRVEVELSTITIKRKRTRRITARSRS